MCGEGRVIDMLTVGIQCMVIRWNLGIYFVGRPPNVRISSSHILL